MLYIQIQGKFEQLIRGKDRTQTLNHPPTCDTTMPSTNNSHIKEKTLLQTV